MAASINKPGQRANSKSVHIRSIALPTEHGAWGFLLEPMLLGMLMAPTLAGLLLACAMFAAFLIHQPLKIATKATVKGRGTPRSRIAWRFAIGYGLTALVLLAIVFLTNPLDFAVPLILALPLVIVQQVFDARNKSRSLIPELAGSLALGAIAPAIVILGGWAIGAALVLWALLALRTVTSILFVRGKLRLEHGKDFSKQAIIIVHLAAIGIAVVVALALQTAWLAVIGMLILATRAYLGLRQPEQIKPKVVGFREMGYGILYTLLIVVGYLLL